MKTTYVQTVRAHRRAGSTFDIRLVRSDVVVPLLVLVQVHSRTYTHVYIVVVVICMYPDGYLIPWAGRLGKQEALPPFSPFPPFSHFCAPARLPLPLPLPPCPLPMAFLPASSSSQYLKIANLVRKGIQRHRAASPRVVYVTR